MSYLVLNGIFKTLVVLSLKRVVILVCLIHVLLKFYSVYSSRTLLPKVLYIAFCRSFLVDVSKNTGNFLLKPVEGLEDSDGILCHAGSAFSLAISLLHVVDNERLDPVKRILPKESRSPQDLVHLRRETVNVKSNVQLRLY